LPRGGEEGARGRKATSKGPWGQATLQRGGEAVVDALPSGLSSSPAPRPLPLHRPPTSTSLPFTTTRPPPPRRVRRAADRAALRRRAAGAPHGRAGGHGARLPHGRQGRAGGAMRVGRRGGGGSVRVCAWWRKGGEVGEAREVGEEGTQQSSHSRYASPPQPAAPLPTQRWRLRCFPEPPSHTRTNDLRRPAVNPPANPTPSPSSGLPPLPLFLYARAAAAQRFCV
jgi:hypothetical protein